METRKTNGNNQVQARAKANTHPLQIYEGRSKSSWSGKHGDKRTQTPLLAVEKKRPL